MTAWNYVFVKDTTPGVCNIQLDQTTNFAVSLYVEGNLCFKNSANIAESNTSDPINLEVRGKIVWLSGASKGIGDTSLANNGQITTAKVAGGCASSLAANGHTCAPATARVGRLLLRQGRWLLDDSYCDQRSDAHEHGLHELLQPAYIDPAMPSATPPARTAAIVWPTRRSTMIRSHSTARTATAVRRRSI